MLVDATLGFVNHLLAGEDWARERLQPFAGQTARVELGALGQTLEITAAGLFAASDTKAPPNVSIRLPADAPLRALTDRPSLLAAAHVSGAAELAETLGFIVRNLRWDVESDLARVVGDIPAARLVSGARALAQGLKQAGERLAGNVGEFLTEEDPVLTGRYGFSVLQADCSNLLHRLDQLDHRMARLESSLRTRRP